MSGAGLLIVVTAPAAAGQGAAAEGTLEARLHISEDGSITVLSGKVDEGQGPRTELAMAAAEELRVPLERVNMVMADTALGPNDGITAGSRTTPGTVPAVRKAAATARELLILVSSRQLNVPRTSLEVRAGTVSAEGRSYSGRVLAEERAVVLAAAGGVVNEPSTWETLLHRTIVVWLKARPEDHWNRVVAQGDRRPMRDHPDAMAELRGMLAARERLYSRSHVVVDTEGTEPEDAAARVVARLEELGLIGTEVAA